MNRINLLKTTKKRQHTSSEIPVKRIVVIAGVLLAVVLSSVIGIVGTRYFKDNSSRKNDAVTITSSPFAPSTYTTNPSIVEEVVQEIGSERLSENKARYINMPYVELSFLEKVNYEVLFAKNVFGMLNRAIPAGIGLKTLELDNFQTCYAVGLGETKELISSTFLALKTEKVELLPQPFSYITSNDGDGYRFVVTCKITSGLDLTDPFQASNYLPSRDDLPIITKKVLTLAENDSIMFSEPQQIESERIGIYRRFHYRYKGTGTYNHFVKLLISLNTSKIPCAFKTITLNALNNSKLAINTHVLFTVKD